LLLLRYPNGKHFHSTLIRYELIVKEVHLK